jgi:O-antigen biosynthesis protein
MMLARFGNLIFFLALIQNVVVCEVSPDSVDHIWNKMGGKWDTWWELWSGLGVCNNDQSLINELNHESCIRRKCLLSWSSSSLIDLNLLRTSSSNPDDYRYHGSLLECALPLGGQTRSKNQVVEVSFIMTLGNNDQQASLSILELYRSAHEVKSSEFIFIKQLGSKELPVTYHLIGNLQKLFNADVKLLIQSTAGAGAVTANSIRLNSNDAIEHAKGEYIALLDDSIIVTPSWISLLLSTLKSPPFAANVGVVGPLLITSQGKVSEAGGILYSDLINYTTGYGLEPNKMTNFQVRTVDFLNSKCLVFKRSLFQDIKFQLFDSKYLTDYGRDVDLAMGLLQRGYVSILQPLAVVISDPDTPPPSHSSTSPPSSSLTQDVHYLKQKYSFLTPSSSSTTSTSSVSFCPFRPSSSCTQTLPPTKLHEMMAMYRQSNRILVLDLIPPEPDKDAGSIRLQEIFNILHKLGYQISFQPNSTGRHVRYALELLHQGIQYLYPGTLRQLSKYVQKYAAHEEVDQCPWDVVIACRRSVIDKQINHLKRLCPQIPIIFDTVDVHFIREQRAFYRQLELHKQLTTTSATSLTSTTAAAAAADMKDMKKEFLILSENTVREVLLMMVSNITYVVSSTEYETIHRLIPSLDVRIVSNIYHPPLTLPTEDPQQRNGALFVGSMCHPPNVDALHFIADEILLPYSSSSSNSSSSSSSFPPEFLFHIVVSRSLECPQTEAISKIQSYTSLVRIYFDVTNQFLEQLHNSVKVVLAPVLVGAGVKGKVNYALLHGVPVISTSIGAEGMYLQTRKSFLLANNGLEFYNGMMELSRDKELWQRLRTGGLEVMKNHFSSQVATEIIQKSLNDLKVLPQQQRRGAAAAAGGGGAGEGEGYWQCPKEMSTSCSSLIHSDQMTLPMSSIDSKVLTQQPPNDKQEYFNLNMRYPHIRHWRSQIMKTFNISLPS